jgi:hypothetical protein
VAALVTVKPQRVREALDKICGISVQKIVV